MKTALLLSLFAATQVAGEQLFIPKTLSLSETKLEIPGYLVDRDSVIAVPEELLPSPQKSYAKSESRLNLGALTSALATGSAGPSSVVFQGANSFTAAAPLCLACTCALGGKTCVELNGVVLYSSGEKVLSSSQSTTCSQSTPCVTTPPSTMSACDPRCKQQTATCDAVAGALNCIGFNQAVCDTACQDRSPGDKVVCNEKDIATGVMNDIPTAVCGYARDPYARTYDYKRRTQGRLLTPASPAAPQSPVRVPGVSFISYAPRGGCIPPEIANVPYCTTLY